MRTSRYCDTILGMETTQLTITEADANTIGNLVADVFGDGMLGAYEVECCEPLWDTALASLVEPEALPESAARACLCRRVAKAIIALYGGDE